MRALVLSASLTLAGCASAPLPPPAPEEAGWLLDRQGDERFVRIAAHLRGLDVAMAETGYRYAELHWAGVDRNWDLASYQLGKIELALARGVERRPKRAASAAMFEGPVAVLKQALTTRDGAAFDQGFVALTATCNACHEAEKVGFMRVVPPPTRTSVLAAPMGR